MVQSFHIFKSLVGLALHIIGREAMAAESSGNNDVEQNKPSSELYFDKLPDQVPIIYRDEYNISLFKLEKVHPFDAKKWGNVIKYLTSSQYISHSRLVEPKEASNSDLRRVHSKSYLNSLTWSVKVAQITEVPPAAIIPNCILQSKVLRPFRYQTGGSVLGGKFAIEHGWAINVGGGFHHCSSDRGGGFCAYADITLAIKFARDYFPAVKKVMIIDLDAHQGNGHERDFLNDDSTYILDMYNASIYPMDVPAKKAITKCIELIPFTEDATYIRLVDRNVGQALDEFKPDFVVYNAGTDVLKGDPLGLLSISAKGIISRDEVVWQHVRQRNIPILMVTSGGYQRSTAKIIADSISNLCDEKIIDLKLNQAEDT